MHPAAERRRRRRLDPRPVAGSLARAAAGAGRPACPISACVAGPRPGDVFLHNLINNPNLILRLI